MTIQRHWYAKQYASRRIEWNELGLWLQWGEWGVSILWR